MKMVRSSPIEPIKSIALEVESDWMEEMWGNRHSFMFSPQEVKQRQLEESERVIYSDDSNDFGSAQIELIDSSNERRFRATNTFYIDYNFLFRFRVAEGQAFENIEWFGDYILLEGDIESGCVPTCLAIVVLPAKDGNKDTVIDFLVARAADGTTTNSAYSASTRAPAKWGNPLLSYDGTWLVPPVVDENRNVRVTQGYNGSVSHQGINAIDMSCPDGEGEPLYPMRDGVIWQIVAQYSEQCETFDDPANCVENDQLSNKVYIAHCDGTTGLYAHFAGPDLISVQVGQRVRARLDQLGPCGTTGISSGPHLHFQVDQSSLDGTVVSSSTVETLIDDVCDGITPAFAPEKGQSWNSIACLEGYDCGIDSSGGSKKKKSTTYQHSSRLFAIDFAAFFLLAALSIILVALCLRVLPASSISSFTGLYIAVLILTWFTTCTDISLLHIEYEDEIHARAFTFSAAMYAIMFLIHACVLLTAVFDYSAHDERWVKDHKFLVALTLLFTLPAIDGISLILPFYPRNSVHGFATNRLCAASILRLFLIDLPQFLIKLVVYQAEVGFSLFAFVSSLASLIMIIILTVRLIKLIQHPPTLGPPPGGRDGSKYVVNNNDRDGPMFAAMSTNEADYSAPASVNAEMVNLDVNTDDNYHPEYTSSHSPTL